MLAGESPEGRLCVQCAQEAEALETSKSVGMYGSCSMKQEAAYAGQQPCLGTMCISHYEETAWNKTLGTLGAGPGNHSAKEKSSTNVSRTNNSY